MSDEQAITLEIDGRVAIITLRLGSKLNALTQPLYYRLASLLRKADAHPDTIVTLLIGEGRFFSAGLDLRSGRPDPQSPSRQSFIPNLVNNTIDAPQAFFSHSKVLITALNGPVFGLSAALIAHSDFIYATPETYLVTPFGSLGLVSEGGAAAAFVHRMGPALANEALLKGRKIGVEELRQAGFISKIIPREGGDFRSQVLVDVKDSFGEHLVPSSIIETKRILRRPVVRAQEGLALDEFFTGLNRFTNGIPQAEMAKVAAGIKKHKL